MPKTVTLYDQNGNETVFQQHFETKIRGKIYVIFTIVGEEEKGGFVFLATPTGPGNYSYTVVVDDPLVQEVFARFHQSNEPEEDEYEQEAIYVPNRLYVPYEVDAEGPMNGIPDSLSFVGSMRYRGNGYVIYVTAYETGGLPKNTPVIFETFDSDPHSRQAGIRFQLVDDFNLVSAIIDAYKAADRSELERHNTRTGEYGETMDGDVTPLEDENGKIWKMSQAACIDLGPTKYFLLTPGFQVQGNDGSGCWIYALRRNQKGNRFLELTEDPVTTRKVMSEYHRLCDAGLGLDRGVPNGDDDDLF